VQWVLLDKAGKEVIVQEVVGFQEVEVELLV
jgi:hypothetical protein